MNSRLKLLKRWWGMLLVMLAAMVMLHVFLSLVLRRGHPPLKAAPLPLRGSAPEDGQVPAA